MSADWKALCREAGLRYDGDVIRVPCGEERFQQVRVEEAEPRVIRLWSRVALRSQVAEDRPGVERPEIEAWLINRYRELVGFKVAERGTIIGEAWIPLIGLSLAPGLGFVVLALLPPGRELPERARGLLRTAR